MESPLITTLTAAQAAVNGIRSLGQKDLRARSLRKHYAVQARGQRLFDFRQMREVTRSASHWSHVGWKDHIDPNQCDALLCPKDPPTRHAHGEPADHDADGRASRGEWDSIAGTEGSTGAEFAEALCGWGCGVALFDFRQMRKATRSASHWSNVVGRTI